MALREFVDERGRQWKVWDVYPTLVERRVTDTGPPPGSSERRQHVQSRTVLSARLAQGWLVFESRDGERRRLGPIPAVGELRWAEAPEPQLCTWCSIAEAAPRVRRLVE